MKINDLLDLAHVSSWFIYPRYHQTKDGATLDANERSELQLRNSGERARNAFFSIGVLTVEDMIKRPYTVEGCSL